MKSKTAYGETTDRGEESREERDRRIEGQYSKAPEDADLSMLAIVSGNQASLAESFRGWRAENSGGSLDEAARRYEVYRWGAQLYPSAHGVLLFAITHRGDAEPQPRRPQLSGPERQRRFDEAAGRKAREMAWPQPPKPEERLAELERQKAELLEEPAERPSLQDA